MKRIIKNLSCALGLMAMLASCGQEYNALTNGIYFGEAQNMNFKNVTVKEEGAVTNLYLSLAVSTNKDIKAELAVDPAVLEEYNKKNGTSYALLPDNYYSLSSKQCVIKAGETSSPLVDVNIKPFDDKLDAAEKYAIPVKITSAEGVDILKPSSDIVILCDKIITTKVLETTGGWNVTYNVEEGDELTSNLASWTVEFLVYSKSFSKNKHLLSFGDKNDKQHSNLFARFGEFDHPTNEIQFKVNHVPFYGVNLFEKNKWYHVAIVCDGTSLKLYHNGELDIVVDHPEPGAKYNWNIFTIKHQNPGMLSEFRIWEVARKQADIVNNMYIVNPKAPGLLTYWKANEGEGDVIKDHTGNGRDLPMPKGQWKEQKFPPEE